MRDPGPVEPASGGYGELLLTSFSTLLLLCALAWLLLRVGAKWLRRGRMPRAHGGPIQRLHQLSLDPRNTLHLVQVGDKTLLLATGERGVALLTEIDADAVARASESERTDLAESRPFRELLSAAIARIPGRRAEPPAPAAGPALADRDPDEVPSQTATTSGDPRP